jgi:hypothetical protein
LKSVNTKKQVRQRPKSLDCERLRRSYRPECVQVLFIGEAPPASGRFFYRADSGLYRAFRDAFAMGLPWKHDSDFLESFRGFGCYLIDLCGKPVDHLNRRQRRDACADGETRLSRMLKQLRPPIVVTVVRSIVPNVRGSIQRAGWEGQFLELPYPGRWVHHRVVFQKQLLPVLQKLKG